MIISRSHPIDGTDKRSQLFSLHFSDSKRWFYNYAPSGLSDHWFIFYRWASPIVFVWCPFGTGSFTA